MREQGKQKADRDGRNGWKTIFKAKNYVTYFGYFEPDSDRTGEKIVHYFLNTQRIFMR